MPTFYDIHCHVMNLSHPCLYAFIRRFLPQVMNSGPVAASILGVVAQIAWAFKGRGVKNLMSVMERDIHTILNLMEKDMSDVGLDKYDFDSIIVTPLMIDFWTNVEKQGIHYEFAPKRIIPQVLDLFNGIAGYAASGPRSMMPLPFMGINPKHYHLESAGSGAGKSGDMNLLLDKYFGDDPSSGDGVYTGGKEDVKERFGKFDGNIDNMGRNYFAGIKVYPPAGFDPWPDDPNDLAKVKRFYRFCCSKKVPIVTHCSDGGYIVDKNKKDAVKRAAPGKWKKVFKEGGFDDLKVCLAHFGGANSGYRRYGGFFDKVTSAIFNGENAGWVDEIVELMRDNGNVYADISYSGVKGGYYKVLRRIINDNPGLENKILFGSDFSINLTSIESYKDYISGFMDTDELDWDLKKKFCSENPERFLWRS